jgi:DNA-binding response OmpR family regulator
MGETILVVDDNQEMVEGLKLTLEMEGFQVLTAGSGSEALEVLERGTTPDLILADIMMPNLDGYELYVRIHHNPKWVQIPFVFLTAKTSKEDIRKGSEIGADAYITKPFDPQDVVATIRGRLKRVAELSEHSASLTSMDAIDHLIQAWQGDIGPLPVPVIVLLLVALLILLLLLL